MTCHRTLLSHCSALTLTLLLLLLQCIIIYSSDEVLQDNPSPLDRTVVQSKKRPFKTAPTKSKKRSFKTVPTITQQKGENGKLTKSFRRGAFGRLIIVGSDEDKPSVTAVKVSPLVDIIYRYLSG